jgi:predicted pyridoxine 5'-phosphate oxidase superfamily flavin-nucleotide-binding protein
MSTLYGEHHRALQDCQDSRRLADRLDDIIVACEIDDEKKVFIESRDLFFLTTVDHRGYPTCSYKGGAPGFVRVPDAKTLIFPSFDGNGMYLSMGNIIANNKVGLLFIDFETPHRIRLHGIATIDRNDPLQEEIVGAEMMVRVAVTEVFVNCPRYIHTYQRVKPSPYVPGGDNPLAPQWKRINAVQDVLPERDRGVAEQLGGVITPEDYGMLIAKGEG